MDIYGNSIEIYLSAALETYVELDILVLKYIFLLVACLFQHKHVSFTSQYTIL